MVEADADEEAMLPDGIEGMPVLEGLSIDIDIEGIVDMEACEPDRPNLEPIPMSPLGIPTSTMAGPATILSSVACLLPLVRTT